MNLDPVPLILEMVLVGGHAEHPLQPVITEFDHPPAAAADEVGVFAPVLGRLVPLEPFAEIVLPDQAALHQRFDRSVEGRQADVFAPFDHAASEHFDRRMIPALEQHFSHQHPLPGDRQPAVPEIPPEPIDQERPVSRGRQ